MVGNLVINTDLQTNKEGMTYVKGKKNHILIGNKYAKILCGIELYI